MKTQISSNSQSFESLSDHLRNSILTDIEMKMLYGGEGDSDDDDDSEGGLSATPIDPPIYNED